MQKWELFTMSCGIGIGGDTTDIWSKKDKKTRKTKWDKLMELASEGWDLVDVTSINFGGTTSEILYTFKKPVE